MKLDQNFGINPKKWGPVFWKTLFFTGLNYPVKIDQSNKCHLAVKRHYKIYFCSLQYTLPCIFCLESYRRFWQEDPIDNYLDNRIDLLKWIYTLKDKVNKKLIQQERQRFSSEKKLAVEKLKKLYGPKEKWSKKANHELEVITEKLRRKVLKTQASPSWGTVLERLAEMR